MEKPGSSKPVTTFVQTDTNTFREIVQRLTGPQDSVTPQAAAIKAASQQKRPTSKLHERRQYSMRPKLEIVKPPTSFRPTGTKSGFLTSPMGTPSKDFSKLSIVEDQENVVSVTCEPNTGEEERAIQEKRFYLHPSPRSKPGYVEPELLTLFPLTSPGSRDKP